MNREDDEPRYSAEELRRIEIASYSPEERAIDRELAERVDFALLERIDLPPDPTDRAVEGRYAQTERAQRRTARADEDERREWARDDAGWGAE